MLRFSSLMMFQRNLCHFHFMILVSEFSDHVCFCLLFQIEKRLGLIRARILGGNESKGDFLAFIDAHVRVAPDWLYEPYVLLMQHPHALVNYINFNLNTKTFEPMDIWKGVGR